VTAPSWDPIGGPGGETDVPLAREEVDFIAMAEEMVQTDTPGQAPAGPVDTAMPGGTAAGTPAGAPVIPPGAYAPPEKVVLDDSLASGYKGALEASSVAGAGVQTADDPFGLTITEKAPPETQTEVHGEKSRLKTVMNVAVIIIAILLAGGVAYAGVYYGFLRKKTASPAEPVAALQDYVKEVLSGDQVRINSVSVPGAAYGSEIMAIVEPLTKQGGVASLKSCEARTTSMTPAGKPTNATVEVSKLVVNMAADGETQVYDLLSASSTNKLRTTVTLINQNGTWKVNN